MYDFFVPTKVLFGAGKLNELHMQEMPGKKALLLMSNGKSARRNGSFDRAAKELETAGCSYAVYDKIQANPLKDTVMDAAAFARENKCDFVVALGGGSVMDAAKAIASMATNKGDLWDYVFGGTGKGKALVSPPLPIIAITTTAGTGSEVDEYGVITNPVTHEKIGFGGDKRLFPVLAVVDPELMLTVPPAYTAYQGFDALFHSTETYISKCANEMSDVVATAAIKAVGRNLAAAVRNGLDLEARTQVAFGNTMSGYSMVVGSCTSEHSLEHAMSAFHQELPHGAGLIMISKAYYEFFIEKHVCDERFVEMAKMLGKENADKPEDFIDALVRLQIDCGVHDLRMSDYGITEGEFEEMAKNAKFTMGGLFESDRCELTIEDCIEIYKKSFR